MLTKVEVRTALGMLLVLPLDEVSSGYVIEDILGLDPVNAVIVSSSFARLDGEQYQASRREKRNILMKIRLEPNYITKTVRDLRVGLYSIFMPKTLVSLRFFLSEGLTVDISARVETCETAMFTKDPVVDISLLCFDPDFVELTPEVVIGETVSNSSEFLLEYNGSVETGIEFVLNVDRALTEFTIYHRAGDDIIHTLDFAAVLQADDVLTINTVVGSKGITLLRDTVVSSLLYGMSPQSNWTELLPGDNHIRVYAVGSSIPFSITYVTRHGGL